MELNGQQAKKQELEIYRAKENSLAQYSQELTTRNNEISIYPAIPAEPMAIARELAKLQVSFPELSLEFMAVLSERLKVNGFSTERLKDAIGHVIDTFPYRRPSVSDIIGFDRKFKLFTYSEVYWLIVEKGEAEWSDFEVVKFNGENFRIKKTDKKLFDYATKTVSD